MVETINLVDLTFEAHFLFGSVAGEMLDNVKSLHKFVHKFLFLPEKHCLKKEILRIESEYGKILTRITPNTDTFYAVTHQACDYM